MASAEHTNGTILITGATGFIGSRLCERLKSEYRLPFKALCRNNKQVAQFKPLGFDACQGDLLQPSTIAAALKGCDRVVHLAHGEDHDGPQVTRNLIEECLRAGIARFVDVSSMSVHGPSPAADAASEETATIGRYGDPYADSKAEQEEIVQAAINAHAFPAVILRPTVVFGPRSPFVVQVLDRARTGAATLIDNGVGLCNAVYVDDVCDAIHAALSSAGAVGQAMFINADAAVTWREFTLAFAKMVDPQPTVRNLSSSEALGHRALHATTRPSRGLLARVIGRVAGKVLPKPTPAEDWPNPGRIARESITVAFSNRKAKELLRWTPQYTFAQGVTETRKWVDAGSASGR